MTSPLPLTADNLLAKENWSLVLKRFVLKYNGPTFQLVLPTPFDESKYWDTVRKNRADINAWFSKKTNRIPADRCERQIINICLDLRANGVAGRTPTSFMI
ncbi:MAG TPA: hypothetical protein VJH91_01290 [Candidatus Paceibacterota bacterium]